ncbi:MAG TPA: SPW repeat protein [Candidatus Angelobacter sp.]|nr:SPW repeat protein [Candidatus Angelobacter sp.]
MNSTIKSLRAGWVDILFGLWVIASPFVLGFANNLAVRWNNVAVGVAVVLLIFVAGKGRRLVRGLMVLLGAWLILSPFVLGFTRTIISWNNLVMGLLIIIGTIMVEAMRPTQLPAMPPHQ